MENSINLRFALAVDPHHNIVKGCFGGAEKFLIYDLIVDLVLS